MEQKQKNKGYLTEKYVAPESIYSRGYIAIPSTLHGTFSFNGEDYHIDGWHTINEYGYLFVSLQAYIKTKTPKKIDYNNRRRFSGSIEELPPEKYIKTSKDDLNMHGNLKIKGFDCEVSGLLSITKEAKISIVFWIFAHKKTK